jgi:signal transduction histidine kinase
VSADPGLLREVVTELLLNALDAVGKGGRIALVIGKRRGGWGALTVGDSGPGITEEQREHLFEPHYTTKPAGTGMGLFTAFAVVHEHRGKLVYEGGDKPGAVFTILLPTASSAESPEPVAIAGDGLNPALLAERFSR